MNAYLLFAPLSLIALSWQVAMGQTSRERVDSNAIQTDAHSYTAYIRDEPPRGRRSIRLRSPIIMTFTNRTKGPIYVPTCFGIWPPVLQQKTSEGAWKGIWGPAKAACLEDPVVIDSGTTYQLKYNILGFMPQTGPRQTEPMWEGVLPGTYRLIWHELYDVWAPNGPAGGLGRKLPEAVSNEFQIVEE